MTIEVRFGSVRDIRDRFGDGTDMLVANMDRGRDLARAFGQDARAVLMRGHGFAAAARTAGHAVQLCKALLDNAYTQLDAMRLGTAVKEMSAGEIMRRQVTLSDDDLPGRMRDFEYETVKAGMGELFLDRTRLWQGVRGP